MIPTQDQVVAAMSVAAKWWADRLRDGAGLGNNGDTDSVRHAMAVGLTALIRSKAPPTAENCDRFETLLAERMTAAVLSGEGCYRDVAGFDNGGPCLRIGVDYGPCLMLHDALIDAGVSEVIVHSAALPCKTRTFASARRVIASHGYGAPFVEIYGPIWGSTFAQKQAADAYIYDQLKTFYDWRDELSHNDPGWHAEPDWQGPIPPSAIEAKP